MYGVHKVQMPSAGCCVSADTLVRSYGATNMAPTQKDKLLSPQWRPHFQTHKRAWNDYKSGHGSQWGQEQLCQQQFTGMKPVS
jgi:hypothetical protein